MGFEFLNYFLVFFLMIFLGEETLFAVGIFSRLGYLDFWSAFFAALLGVFSGDLFWFKIGEIYGEKFVLRFGRYIFITPERFKKLEAMIKKRGGFYVFFSKFIHNLNHISLVAAGAVKFNFKKFVKYQALTSLIWTSIFLSLGYLFTDNLAKIKHDVKLFTGGILLIFIIFIILDTKIGTLIKEKILRHA